MARVLFAFAAYTILALGLFGRDVLGAPGDRVVGDGGADKTLYMWSFVWWPDALARLHDPLAVDVAWAPGGFDLGWANAGAGLAVAAAPVTALGGPVIAYNVFALSALSLSATTAFLLARRLTASFAPSLLAGYLYGFSSYQLGHLVGHLPLVFVALVPAVLHLAIRRFDADLGPGSFVAGLGALLAAQFLVATKVLFSAVVLAALLGPLVWLVLGRDHRVLRVLLESGAALLLCGALSSPFLFHAIRSGTGYVPERSAFAESLDLTNVVAPTRLTWLRPPGADLLSERFTGTTAELGGYLGAPLLVIALLAVRQAPRARVLGLALGVSFALSLGTRVKVAGEVVAPAPWAAFEPLPVVGSALPARFAVFTSLAAALLAAIWLAEHQSPPRWTFALVGALLLVQNLSLGLWSADVPRNQFFAQGRYTRFLAHQDIALVLPYGPAGWSMLWQAENGMDFRLVGGHFGIRVIPPERQWADVYRALGTGRVGPGRMRAFLVAHRVKCVVVAPGTRPRVEQVVASAVGRPPVRSADAHVYVLGSR